MIETFVAALTDAATDDTLRAIHIRGAGDDFCAGVDWVATNSEADYRPRSGDLVRRIPHTAHRVIELVHSIHLPVVCSVRGFAAGLGCNLALAADFTVAANDAVFWEPFAARGFSPDSGATWLLPRLVGLTRAKQMLLLGDKVSGTDAAAWGLIHQAVGPAGPRRQIRGTAGTTGRRPHGGARPREARHSLRSARHADPGDDARALRRRTLLPNKRFQRGSGGIPGTTPAAVPRPLNQAPVLIHSTTRNVDVCKSTVIRHH